MIKKSITLYIIYFFLLWINLSCEKTEHPLPFQQELKDNWEFRQVGKKEWMNASVPGTVHQDLLTHKIIEDPFYGLNELKVQWIENQNWEYRSSFHVSKETLLHENLILEFKGLDTYADVYLNDSLILSADNMFRTWEVDCNNVVKEGNNHLKILFKSPVKIGMEKLNQLGFLIPVQNEQAPKGKQTSVFTRKAAYHYGWDWGPRLVTSGIWQPIYFKGWSHAQIRDVFLQPKNVSKERADYQVNVEITATKESKGKLELYLDDKKLKSHPVELTKGSNIVRFDLNIDRPVFWWSAGLGDQKLYNVKTSLILDDKVKDTRQSKLGIRTLKVIQKPDTAGKSFYVELNGMPVFMKGANYIPGDNLIPRVDSNRYRRVIDEALSANMNMLRVWGGAIYETDYFYELCMEKGILLYHDFMFACSMYPGDQEMVENIRLEAEEQIKRMRNYPNLVLWAGNNEILNGWHEWNYQERFGYNDQQKDTLWKYYQKIFYEVLPQAVKKHDPEKLYWACSPQSEQNKLQNEYSGDQHFWPVWFGELPFSAYEKNPGRFISEYGFQSYPCMNTLKKIARKDKDLHWDSELMLKRQRSPMENLGPGKNGNHMIERYLEKEFMRPKDFESYVYISQLLHAQAIRIAAEAHRRNMPYTMGSMYWQLNDCWPTISWSTVDYFGNWKAAHYQAKNSYKDLLLSVTQKDNQINTYLISDRPKATSAVLEMILGDFIGNKILKDTFPVNIDALSSKIFVKKKISELLKGRKKQDVYLRVALRENGKVAAENLFFFVPHKLLSLPKPQVRAEITKTDKTYSVKVRTDMFAKNVYIYFDGLDANLSDNFFDLEPNSERAVEFSSVQNISVQELHKKLKILTVAHTY